VRNACQTGYDDHGIVEQFWRCQVIFRYLYQMAPHNKSDQVDSDVSVTELQQGTVYPMDAVLNVRDACENKIGKDGRYVHGRNIFGSNLGDIVV
jgi:hypothetical protein